MKQWAVRKNERTMDFMPDLSKKDKAEGAGEYGTQKLPAFLSEMQGGNTDSC